MAWTLPWLKSSFLPHKPFRARKASVIQVLWIPDFIAAVRCRHWQGIGDTLHNAWYLLLFIRLLAVVVVALVSNPNFHLKLIDIDDQFDHMNEVKLTVNLTKPPVFKDHTLKNQSISTGDSSSAVSCSPPVSLLGVPGFSQPAAFFAKNHLSNDVTLNRQSMGPKV